MDVIASGTVSSSVQLQLVVSRCFFCKVNSATHLVVIINEIIAMKLEGLIAEARDETAKGKI